MNDVTGKRLHLEWLEPWQAEQALGICLASNGSTLPELQFCKEQTLQWAMLLLHSKAP